jgi:hypothetical protein
MDVKKLLKITTQTAIPVMESIVVDEQITTVEVCMFV